MVFLRSSSLLHPLPRPPKSIHSQQKHWPNVGTPSQPRALASSVNNVRECSDFQHLFLSSFAFNKSSYIYLLSLLQYQSSVLSFDFFLFFVRTVTYAFNLGCPYSYRFTRLYYYYYYYYYYPHTAYLSIYHTTPRHATKATPRCAN